VIFLKLTRTARSFFTRFGWLIAELIFVFLGLYGAFLLERANDDKNDLIRKKQILEALVDEFVEYESDLIAASEKLDEGYGIPFFTAYSGGEKPFPQPLPFGHGGGLGDLNTGIWEAMLQSGGIDVLEVDMIQEVQQFFKKFQDMHSVYERFERMVELMIMPELDQNNTFFYQSEGPELRDKYKWYVHQLFTIGMSLRDLSEQAGSTKKLLQAELIKTLALQQPKPASRTQNLNDRKRTRRKLSQPPKQEPVTEQDQGDAEQSVGESPDELSDDRAKILDYLTKQCQAVAGFFESIKAGYDEGHALPFFNPYSEGARPMPVAFTENLLEGISSKPLSEFLASPGIENVLPVEILESLSQLIGMINEAQGMNQEFIRRCEAEISSVKDANATDFYEGNATELTEEYRWYPSLLYSMGLALEGCQAKATAILGTLTSLESTTGATSLPGETSSGEELTDPTQDNHDSPSLEDEE